MSQLIRWLHDVPFALLRNSFCPLDWSKIRLKCIIILIGKHPNLFSSPMLVYKNLKLCGKQKQANASGDWIYIPSPWDFLITNWYLYSFLNKLVMLCLLYSDLINSLFWYKNKIITKPYITADFLSSRRRQLCREERILDPNSTSMLRSEVSSILLQDHPLPKPHTSRGYPYI